MKKTVPLILLIAFLGYYFYKTEKLNSELMEMNIELTQKYFDCIRGGNNNELIYENGIQKVEIKILNGNDYLEYDKPTKTDFVLTNIEPKTFSVYGAGIRVLGTKGETMKTEIKVPINYLETDTLNVKIRFGEKPEENHEFNIPMKTTE
ncbi:hypothetical protein [Aequorivita xiaoshiensis]|uniref:Uncharacterized protein n=1 Tax=Aequorivita xiaoshiensis TaxID=2874476 RepID=A0A9X1R4P0_9FLAO|nr:hypothetical protein [Aequorivita xiaoshiensis]MCG2432229.1 hypothetical protein [Aequorivita xiaoshiensis]